MSEQITNLPDFTSLTVTGQDAATFLQGQVTCDVLKLPQDQAGLGAFCNQKGQVISSFIIWSRPAGFELIVPKVLAESLLARLGRYVLRAKVKLERSTESSCLGLLRREDAEPLESMAENRLKLSGIEGWRRELMIVPDQSGPASDPAWLDLWRYQDLRLGWPWLTTKTSEQYIPQTLRLDKLGAVSFDKGCYTGQEIVARTHYLGKAKRGLYCARARVSSVPEAMTDVVTEQGQAVGKVFAGACFEGFCYLHLILPDEMPKSEALFLASPEGARLEPVSFLS